MKTIYQGEVEITEKIEVARETFLFRFKVNSMKTLTGEEVSPEDFTFDPGQFISLQFTPKAWRAYSIASIPEETLELAIRLVEGGVGSEILRISEVGAKFNFKAPFGHFVLTETENAPLYFCGTGTGIAPLRSMILEENKKENPRNMTLLYGGRDIEDIAYTEDLDTWSNDLNIRLGLSRDENAKEKSPYAENCRITQFLEEEIFPENAEFYICGNGSMVKSVVAILKEKGFEEKTHIFMERFN